MEKEGLIQLTNDLYRLTLLFPKKEPLRYKIRGLADDILMGFLRLGPLQEKGITLEINRDLEVLGSFFAVAGTQNWVSSSTLLSVSQRYDNLKQETEDMSRSTSISESGTDKTPETAKAAVDFNSTKGNTQRHDRILGILKEKGRAQVWEFKQILPGVSKRTLRRDFEYLLSQGLVERMGEKNQTFYQTAKRTEEVVTQYI